MKLFLLVILSVINIGGTFMSDDYDYADNAGYILYLSSQRKQNSIELCKIYVDAIMRYTKMYNLPVRYIARQIFRESFYNHTLIHPSGARGACQLMSGIDNDRIIKKTETYMKDVSVREQYHHIWPSVQSMCMLMRRYVDQYTNYNRALCAYWTGCNSTYTVNFDDKLFQKTEYYKAIIIDGYIEKYLIEVNRE